MLNVVIFNGGRGASSIINALRNYKHVQLTSIVNAFDDGKSTGEIREFFDMLGPSDLRKVQELMLINDDPLYQLKKQIFNYRYPQEVDGKIIKNELTSFCEKRANKIADININDETIAEFLRKSLTEFIIHLEIAELLKGRIFNFSDCSLMNCIYAGVYLIQKRNLLLTSKIIEKIFGIWGTVLPVSENNLKLCAIREDGTFLGSEAEIVELRSNIRIKDIYFVRENINKIILDKLNYLQKQKYLSNLNCHVNTSQLIIDTILNADIIIYAPGTQHSSLYPTYCINGISKAISVNRKATKFFVTNIGADYETPSYKASDYILGAYRYLKIGANDKLSMNDLFDYNFVNGNRLDQSHSDQNYVDLDLLGFTNIEIKLLIDNYEDQVRRGYHDGKKIVSEILEIHNKKFEL